MTSGVINGDAVTLITAIVLVVIVFRLVRLAFQRLFQSAAADSEFRELHVRLALSEVARDDLRSLYENATSQHREDRQRAERTMSAFAQRALLNSRSHAAVKAEPVPPVVPVAVNDPGPRSMSELRHGVLPYATAWEAADDIVSALRATSLDDQLTSAYAHLDELTRRAIERSSLGYPEILLILRALDEGASELFGRSLDSLVARLQHVPLRTAVYNPGVIPARRSDVLVSSGQLAGLDPAVVSSAPTLVSRYDLRQLTRFAREFQRLRQLAWSGPPLVIIAADASTAERARACAGRRTVLYRVDPRLVAGFQLRSDVGDVDESLHTRILRHFESKTKITTL